MNPTTRQPHITPTGSAGPEDRGRPVYVRQTPNGFEQRLLARARAGGLAQSDRIVVGFSGGRDSLALAAAVRRLYSVLGVAPYLVHIDHNLRSDSAEDARRAEALAHALGLRLQVVEVPGVPMALHPGVGTEEAARRERYRLLFREASRLGARAVATAHHEGDQAETVLLHLLRGGGVHGAAAMAEWSSAPMVSADDGTPPSNISPKAEAPLLWRPLLRESRRDIEAYVARLGLSPIEDPSNDDVTLRRNALRREVLPLLEHHVPGATAALARYAALASEDDAALDDLATEVLTGAVDPGGQLDAASLRGQPLAVARRMVRQWLLLATGTATFSAERTDAILHLARAGGGGTAIEAGEGWMVRRVGGTLRLEKHQDRTAGEGE